MAVQAIDEARCGVGSRLQVARERKGFSVLQAAERLHVDPHVVEHLESENFQALGAPVYVRGHLRRYAELVGEQPQELQALYSQSVTTAQPDLTRVPKAETPDDSGKLLMPALIGLVGFLLVGAAWWVLTNSGRATPAKVSANPPAPEQLSVSSSPVARPTAAPAVSKAAASAVSQKPAQSPPPVLLSARSSAPPQAAPLAHVRAPKSAPPAPPRVVPKKPAAVAAIRVKAVKSKKVLPVVVASAAKPAAAARVKQTTVTLKFNAVSWAEVYDASGKRLFYNIGSANSVTTLHGRPPIRVMLGNGPGVGVLINGQPVAIKSTLHSDGSAHFVISREGRIYRR